MALLIDAYNVLHSTHVLPDKFAEVGAAGLCRMIDKAGARGGARVVCDGAPHGKLADARQIIGHVELIYAGGGKDADSLIEKLIEEDHAPRELIVVSNDRRLIAAAKKRKATPLSSEEFLHRLAAALRPRRAHTSEKPAREPDPESWVRAFTEADPEAPALSPDELTSETLYWLREFGFEEKD